MINFTRLAVFSLLLTNWVMSAAEIPLDSFTGTCMAMARRFPMSEESIILNAPAGQVSNWIADGYSYMLTWDGVGIEEMTQSPMQLVETDDNEVYLLNIIPSCGVPGWVRGHREGEVITIPLPQRVQEIEFDDFTYVYQVDMLRYIEGEELSPWAFEVDESVDSVCLTRTTTGWRLELPDDGSKVLGLTCANEEVQSWMGYADIMAELQPIPWNVAEVPQSPQESYAMVSENEGHLVKAAFEGGKCFLQGISPLFADSWIMGEISDGSDSVVFKSDQFLGLRNDFAVEMGLFQGAEYGLVVDEWGSEYMNYIPKAEAVFSLDSSNGSLTMSEQAVLINTSANETKCLAIYWEPSLYPQPDNAVMQPVMPMLLELSDYNTGLGYSTVVFTLSNLNAEGYVIPQQDLYYTLKIDGEYIMVEGNPHFAFGFSDYEIVQKYGSERKVRIYSPTAKTLQVELVYAPEGQEELHSPVLVVNLDASAVTSTDVCQRRVQWYDMTGCTVTSPRKGDMLIKVSNGNAKKVIY